MQYKTTEKAGTTKYVVELDLQESGIYKINVNQLTAGKRNKILQAEIAYDTDLTFSKELIEGANYRIRVASKSC